MPTNLSIDNDFIEQAKEIGKSKTKKAAVTEALEEHIQRRKQAEIIRIFGTIDYDEPCNYKDQRKKNEYSPMVLLMI